MNEYPWIASFDFSGVNGQNPGGCAATLVSFYLHITENFRKVQPTELETPCQCVSNNDRQVFAILKIFAGWPTERLEYYFS